MKSPLIVLIKRSLLFWFAIALCAFSPERAPAQGVSTVGSPWVLIQTGKGASAPCGASKTVYFDGAISPFSYIGTSGQTVVQVNASLGNQNFRYLGSLTSEGDLAANYVVDCNGGQSMYTSLKSPDPASFRWGEWLYGFYRSTTTGYVYATIYNEYYGGNYAPGAIQQNGCRVDHPEQCNYSGIGLARSVNNGKTFSPIQAAPNHVIARVPYPYYSNAGHPMGSAFEGGGTFFSNPNDIYLYRALNQFKNTVSGDYGVTMMRTRKVDIDDPTSWRVWDGAGYNGSFYPSGAYGETIPLPFGSPFYLGWSSYFQTYIATGVCGSNYCFTFSSDMIHWSPGITIMPIDPQAYAESGSGLPSLLDPSYLAQTSNDSAANGGMVGQNPYLTFIRQNVSSTIQQQVVVQQVHFDDPTPPVVSIVAPSNGAQLSGLEVQVSASASDNVRVVGVQFKLDGSDLGTEVTVPNQGLYSTTWNLTAAAGDHTLTAVARDGAGNTTTSTAVVVSVILSGTLSAYPNPCVIPPGGTQCSTFVSWTTSPSLPETAHVRAYYGGPTPIMVVIGCGPNSVIPTELHLTGGSVDLSLNYVPACNVVPFYNTTLASVTVSATSPPDTTPPDVVITAPASGAVLSATMVTVSAVASDNVGVAGVQFKLDGNPLNGEVTIPSQGLYSTSWNTTGAAGSHTLTAVARDAAGNPKTSAAVPVTVSLSGTISASPNPCNVSGGGTQCSRFISWTTSASLPATAQVKIRVDGGPNEVLFACLPNSGTPVEAPWIALGHTVDFRLYPASDCTGSATLGPLLGSVTVTAHDATPPTVAITAPAAGAVVSGAAVTVSATASDNVGVAGVQFKLDGSPLGAEVTISARGGLYSISWNTTLTPNGSHALTAVARDGANTTVSAPRTVTVNNVASQ